MKTYLLREYTITEWEIEADSRAGAEESLLPGEGTQWIAKVTLRVKPDGYDPFRNKAEKE